MAFLVLEGLDGSGKSTQIKMLCEYLEGKGKEYSYIHFPRTGEGIFGGLIAMFLRGELGRIDEVNPYLVSLIYAADRHDMKEEMEGCISEGRLLVADRYVMSNVAFQCAKLDNPIQRKELREWICQLEYFHYGIPQPDLNIFLDVPFEFTREKLTGRRSGSERRYLEGSRDIHEADLDFQKRVREVYLQQSGSVENMKIISCYDDQMRMLEPAAIFNRIRETVENEKILNI